MKLLCLSEDESLGQQVCTVAGQMQWSAVWIHDRSAMAQAIVQFNPDMILVDVAKPNGRNWWQEGRAQLAAKPTLLVNWELEDDFLAQAFEGGADGFLQMPFSAPLLAAQLKALARRGASSAQIRHFATLGLTFDYENCTVDVRGQPVPLTLTEFRILRELTAAEGRAVLRGNLQSKVFGDNKVSNRSLDVHVCSVRKKFKPLGIDIDSVRGVGYRVSPCRI